MVTGILSAQQPLRDALPPICYFSSASLTARDERIVSALIGIHGARGSAEGYLRLMTGAAAKAGKGDSTLAIAPKFYETDELGNQAARSPYLSWGGGWRYGNESVPTAAVPTRYSSFTVIDLFVRHLANRALFPNLRTIVVAGHSAGGQFVARYAAGNVVEDIVSQMNIRMRYAISSPSSFLYFTPERPIAASPGRFAVPVGPRDYHRYPYGMDGLNDYMRQLGLDGIKARYPARQITYLIGDLDNDPKANNGLDLSKAAMRQGAQRLERTVAYWQYLQGLFGEKIRTTQACRIIPKTGHSGYQIFVTPEGLASLFEPERLRATEARVN
jgi:hypothetical protein